MDKLNVISIRYFETRRGLGYECKTNQENVVIWNDGMGGGTFVSADNRTGINLYNELDEEFLEGLINKYEGVCS